MAETPKHSLAGGWVHGGRHSLTAWRKAEKGSSWGLQWPDLFQKCFMLCVEVPCDH